LARTRQPQRKQENLRPNTTQINPQISEVHFSLSPRRMRLRHKPRLSSPPRLGQDLPAAPSDIITHRRIRHPDTVLIDQPGHHATGGMALLAGRVEISPQHRIDQRFGRIQTRRRERTPLTRRRHRGLQRLTDRAPVHPVTGSELADPHTIAPGIAADRLIQLHPRPQPGPPTSRLAHSTAPERAGWGPLALSHHPVRVAGGATYL